MPGPGDNVLCNPSYDDRVKQITSQTLQGIPQTKIAKSLGISQPRVSEIVNQEGIRELIEEQRQLLLSEDLAKSRQNIHELVHSKLSRNHPAYKLQIDKSDRLLTAAGILPGPFPSVFVDARQVHIHPVVTELVGKFIDSLSDSSNDFDSLDD